MGEGDVHQPNTAHKTKQASSRLCRYHRLLRPSSSTSASSLISRKRVLSSLESGDERRLSVAPARIRAVAVRNSSI
jgi:hypothetical protein